MFSSRKLLLASAISGENHSTISKTVLTKYGKNQRDFKSFSQHIVHARAITYPPEFLVLPGETASFGIDPPLGTSIKV